MGAQASRAAHRGVLLGLGVIALAVILQSAVGVWAFTGYDNKQRLAYLVLPFVLAVLMVLPVRPSKWPVTDRRARNVGLVWLALGLAWPAWLALGQLPVAAGLLAGPMALAGALTAAWRRD